MDERDALMCHLHWLERLPRNLYSLIKKLERLETEARTQAKRGVPGMAERAEILRTLHLQLRDETLTQEQFFAMVEAAA